MKILHILVGATVLAATSFAWHGWYRSNVRLNEMQKDVTNLAQTVESREKGPTQGDGLLRQLLAAGPRAEPTAVPALPSWAQPALAAASQKEERQELKPIQIREQFDSLFSSERSDPSWANAAQRTAQERLSQVLPPGSEVRSVECRASLCRIETSHADVQHYQEYFQKAFLDHGSQIWNGGVFDTVLEDASAADGRFVTVAFLAKDGAALPSPE